MLKYLSCVLVFFGSIYLVTAQVNPSLFPLKQQQLELSFSVILLRDSTNITGLGVMLSNDTLSDIYIKENRLNLLGPDLQLSLLMQKPEKGLIYQVSSRLFNKAGELMGQTKRTLIGKKRIAELFWEDITEEGFFPGANYQAIINTTLLGPVDCGVKPRFTIANWDWLALAGVGAGAFGIGLGQVYRQQNQSNYNSYLNNWENGDISPLNATLYNNASTAYQNSRTATFVGAGLFIVGSAALYLRWRSHRHRTRIYHKYCTGGGMSFQLGLANGELPGLAITGTFN